MNRLRRTIPTATLVFGVLGAPLVALDSGRPALSDATAPPTARCCI